MGWIKRVDDAHKCKFPVFNYYNRETRVVRTGDVWECDECHEMYEVTVTYGPPTFFSWTLLGH